MAIKKPPFTKGQVSNFGLPRGASGRNLQTPQVIVLHCTKQQQIELDAEACSPYNVGGNKPDEVSYHFTVADNGIREYVDINDVAWAWTHLFGAPINFANFYWSAILSRAPVAPYLYTVDIGIIESKGFDTCETCELPIATTKDGYKNLVRLLAWIRDTYLIPIDTNHIQYHNDIEFSKEGECKCKNLAQLIIDVANYEDPCDDPGLPGDVVDEVELLYGETDKGCFVKIEPSDVLCNALSVRPLNAVPGIGGVSRYLAPDCTLTLLPVYRLEGLDPSNDIIITENGIEIDRVHIPTFCEGLATVPVNATPLVGGDRVLFEGCFKRALPIYSHTITTAPSGAVSLNLLENGTVIDSDTFNVTSAVNLCDFGNRLSIVPTLTDFVGRDINGCLVAGFVNTDATIDGNGTTLNPLSVNICALAAVIPAGVADSFVGIDAGQCLVRDVIRTDFTLTGAGTLASPLHAGFMTKPGVGQYLFDNATLPDLTITVVSAQAGNILLNGAGDDGAYLAISTNANNATINTPTGIFTPSTCSIITGLPTGIAINAGSVFTVIGDDCQKHVLTVPNNVLLISSNGTIGIATTSVTGLTTFNLTISPTIVCDQLQGFGNSGILGWGLPAQNVIRAGAICVKSNILIPREHDMVSLDGSINITVTNVNSPNGITAEYALGINFNSICNWLFNLPFLNILGYGSVSNHVLYMNSLSGNCERARIAIPDGTVLATNPNSGIALSVSSISGPIGTINTWNLSIDFNAVCNWIGARPVGAAVTAGVPIRLLGEDCQLHTLTLSPGFVETPITPVTSPTVIITAFGVSNHTITADVRVSALGGNTLQVLPDGLYASPETNWSGFATGAGLAALIVTPSGVAGHNPTFDFDLSRLALAPACSIPVSVIGGDNRRYTYGHLAERVEFFGRISTEVIAAIPCAPNSYLFSSSGPINGNPICAVTNTHPCKNALVKRTIVVTVVFFVPAGGFVDVFCSTSLDGGPFTTADGACRLVNNSPVGQIMTHFVKSDTHPAGLPLAPGATRTRFTNVYIGNASAGVTTSGLFSSAIGPPGVGYGWTTRSEVSMFSDTM